MIPAGAVRAFMPAIRAMLGDQLVFLVLARAETNPSGVQHVDLHSTQIRVVDLIELLEDDKSDDATDLEVTILGPPGVTYTLSLSMGESS